MDVGIGNVTEATQVIDQVGSRCQKLFQDFLEDYREGQDLKYLKSALELIKPEKNTLLVSMKDVEQFNTNLAQSITDDYYRLYPYLCAALKNFIKDRSDEETVAGMLYFSISVVLNPKQNGGGVNKVEIPNHINNFHTLF